MSAGNDTTAELLSAIQIKVAVSAIPPSAMRSQGGPGVAAAARKFLAKLPLRPFAALEETKLAKTVRAINGRRVTGRLECSAAHRRDIGSATLKT
jgi:hypothetical protein